jgi:tyrosine-protein kinase Etk/Wzc
MAIDAPDSGLQKHVVPSSGAPGQAHATATPGSVGDEISLLDLLIILTARRRLIFWFTAVFAILAIIISLILPKRYTAAVVLLPPQQNSSLSTQLAAQLGSFGGIAASLAGGGGGSFLRNPNDMYVAMFKSRFVEDAMVERFELMREYHKKYRSDARKKFEHYATVDGSGKDGLIHISVEDGDPQRATDLANGYVDQFRNLTEHLAITEAGQRRLFFEKQLQQANQSLTDAEESLKETEQKTGLIAIDAQTRALIESAALLRAQVAAKEVQIQAMRTYATGENAQLVEAQQELDSLRAQLTRLAGSSDDSGGIIVPKGQMSEGGVEYVTKLRDVKYYEAIFEILARQFELAKLDEAKEGAVVQVVDPATVPDKRSFPKRTIIVILATFVGFLAGIFAALCQAAYDRMKVDPDTSSKLSFLRRAWSDKLHRSPQN